MQGKIELNYEFRSLNAYGENNHGRSHILCSVLLCCCSPHLDKLEQHTQARHRNARASKGNQPFIDGNCKQFKTLPITGFEFSAKPLFPKT
jgi:hypothetical protein